MHRRVALALAIILTGSGQVLAAPLPQTLEGLRAVSRQPLIAGWKEHPGDTPDAATPEFNDSTWPLAKPDSKGNLNWGKGRQVLWLRQWVTVPPTFKGYASTGTQVKLNLIWWAEKVEIYVNGRFVQSGDLYDAVQRVILTPSAQPGERFLVALKLVSPGHDAGALTQARLDIEAPSGSTDPGMLADELDVLDGYLKETANARERQRLQPVLKRSLERIDWQALKLGKLARFDASLKSARTQLAPFAALTRSRTIGLLGHSHIDMAWLWPVPETRQVVEKTFRSTLGLMGRYPQLNFAQSTAQSYRWIESEQPQLFEQIKEQVRRGRWELVGGMWVEPDLNLPDGESLIRQVLYGKQYFKERFGKEINIGWNPDSFGYTWQLPQIYKKAGIDYFLTQKLDWNDTTRFPHRIFWWQAPDGSKILTYFATPLGEQVDAVKMATKARAYEKNTGYPNLLWMYGVGDHGGGPTRDMLETAERWQRSPVFPKLVPTTASQYFQSLKAADRKKPFPTWNSELYLEFHRGTYTTHAGQKQHNRQAEVLLANLEKFASARSLFTGAAYPHTQLASLWKLTLFNQFHDILPGSAIRPVYVQAASEQKAFRQQAEALLATTLKDLASRADTRGEGTPVVVFNSLATVRSAPVEIAAGVPEGELVAVDSRGQTFRTQRIGERLQFWATEVPGVGYKTYWLRPAKAHSPEPAGASVLENDNLRVTVDPATGDLSSVYDKRSGRESLNGPGNQLQLFKDEGQYWDAWNIDPQYEKHPLPAPRLVSIERVESGPVRSTIRVTRTFGKSTFVQDLILYHDSPALQITNQIDWQERHVLLKTAFHLKAKATQATYEIPFAAIARSTRRDTPARKAQWEVPALRWASVNDLEGGASLLNDSKYGYDARELADGTRLRLSLLRGSEWPDPEADLGQHQFSYVFYPHAGDWRKADAVQAGLSLNTPFIPVVETVHTGTLPEQFVALDNPQVVLAGWKRAEDGDGWIVRLYESKGSAAKTKLTFPQPPRSAVKTDLLERPQSNLSVRGNQIDLPLGPFEIQTLRVRF